MGALFNLIIQFINRTVIEYKKNPAVYGVLLLMLLAIFAFVAIQFLGVEPGVFIVGGGFILGAIVLWALVRLIHEPVDEGAAPGRFQPQTNTMVWGMVLLFLGAGFFVTSSIIFNWPAPMQNWLFTQKSQQQQPLEAITKDAVPQLTGSDQPAVAVAKPFGDKTIATDKWLRSLMKGLDQDTRRANTSDESDLLLWTVVSAPFTDNFATSAFVFKDNSRRVEIVDAWIFLSSISQDGTRVFRKPNSKIKDGNVQFETSIRNEEMLFAFVQCRVKKDAQVDVPDLFELSLGKTQ